MADKFGLRAWTINLRTWIFGFTCLVFKTTCIDRGKPLREGAFSSREQRFSLRWIRGILAIRRRACVSLRRGISGSWASLAPPREAPVEAHLLHLLGHQKSTASHGEINRLTSKRYSIVKSLLSFVQWSSL